MKTSITLDEVLSALKRYCEKYNMDGLDLWYWLKTNHVSLDIKPQSTDSENK